MRGYPDCDYFRHTALKSPRLLLKSWVYEERPIKRKLAVKGNGNMELKMSIRKANHQLQYLTQLSEVFNVVTITSQSLWTDNLNHNCLQLQWRIKCSTAKLTDQSIKQESIFHNFRKAVCCICFSGFTSVLPGTLKGSRCCLSYSSKTNTYCQALCRDTNSWSLLVYVPGLLCYTGIRTV